MSTVPNDTAADFESLAAERKPISNTGGQHKMVQVGDELTGTIVKSETISGKYGEFGVIKVDPVKAVSDDVDTTALGEVELRCTGYELEEWYASERPEAGDLVSIRLADLINIGKDSPLKHYETALRRPADYDPEPAPGERPPPHDDDDIPVDQDFGS